MKSQSENWLSSADDDLILISEIIRNEHLTHMVAFHCQQVIEKSFKAIQEEKEGKVPRIHNIITLRGRTEKHINLDIDESLLIQFNELYTDSRYSTDFGLLPNGKPSSKIAIQFFETATMIFEIIKAYLLEYTASFKIGNREGIA